MEYRNPTKEEVAIGIKAAKAAGIAERDWVKAAVDDWHIHMGKMRKPKGWKDPYASLDKKKPTVKAKKKAK